MGKRIASLLILVAAVAVTLSAAADALKPFIGTWEGKHEGKTYAILKLKDVEHLSGTISLGNIHTDEDGNITDVTEAADDESPILDPKLDGKKLMFGWKDGDDVTRIEMTLTGAGEAELRFLSENGTPPVVRLRKVE